MTHEPLSINYSSEYDNLISIRMSSKQYKQLNNTAELLNCNVSQVIRAIIDNYYKQ